MAWTAVNPVAVGNATKKPAYDTLWDNALFLKNCVNGISALNYGALGDGATDDTAAFTTGLASLTSGGVFYVPPGVYILSSPLVLPADTIMMGAGRTVSILSFTHTGDGIQSTSVINSSVAVNRAVLNVWIKNTNGANIGGGFAEVGGTFVNVEKCKFSGWKYGIIYDQTEIASIVGNEFLTCSTACLWLVNGLEHSYTTVASSLTAGAARVVTPASMALIRNGMTLKAQNADGTNSEVVTVTAVDATTFTATFASNKSANWLVGANGLYTNQITITGNNQFNGGAVGIADDGGSSHTIQGNNFNSGTIAIRANQVNNLLISGNECETQTTTCVLFTNTKVGGGPGVRSTTATIQSNLLYPDTAMPAIDIDSLSLNRLTVSGNVVLTSSTAFEGVSNLDEMTAFDNHQIGGGDPDYLLNNYITGQNYVAAPSWTGSISNPAIENGSIDANWSRKGNEITVTYKIVMGSETTFGEGYYSFSLPFVAAAGVVDYLGSGMLVDNTGNYTTVVPRVVQGGIVVNLFYTGGAVAHNAPFTFAESDQILFTIKYLYQVETPVEW